MNLLIRDFPDSLHKALKIRAAQEGKPLKNLIVELLEVRINENAR
ncbi:MAG TPA: hypothetical protein VMW95_05610 [Desulfobacterales bacterium]|nr:hypothetical protein [Desulfobacterales bacterium]